MSSQGSGEAVRTYSIEDELLKAWGCWLRQDSLGMGFSIPMEHTASELPLFSESTCLCVDGVIAGLPRQHKQVIKHVWWWKRVRPIELQTAALSEFSEAWANLEINSN